MQRLKTRAQFQAALAGGTVARTPHFALHCLALHVKDAESAAPSAPAGPVTTTQALFPVAELWLGAMVPKRWARRAVTRNAIKRQIYSVAPTWEARMSAAAYVVRLRAPFDRKQFISAQSDLLKQAVRAELLQLFARAARHAGAAATTVQAQP